MAQAGKLANLNVREQQITFGSLHGPCHHPCLRGCSLLRTPKIVRRMNRAVGGVMIGAGVAVFATR
jgi:hypothetical protein